MRFQRVHIIGIIGLTATAAATGITVAYFRTDDSSSQAQELTQSAFQARQASENITDITMGIVGAASLGFTVGLLAASVVGYGYYKRKT